MERKDMIMMKEGRLMLIRNDQPIPMEMDMTLPDGTTVRIDGTVLMPDGTTRRIMEGEALTLEDNLSERTSPDKEDNSLK